MRIAYNLLEGTDPVQLEIIKHLCSSPGKDINLILKVNIRRKNRIETLPYSPMFFGTEESGRLSWLRQEILLPFAVSENSIDILYCPSFCAPLRQASKTVAVAPDADHLLFEDQKPCGLENRIRSFIRTLAAKKANRLIVYSNFYRKVLQKTLKLPESRISVVPYPCSDVFRPVFDASLVQAVQKKYGIPGQYYIYSGRYFKKNNIKELIEIFTGGLGNKNNASLVLAGFGAKDPGSIPENSVFRNRIVFLETVSDEELALLYNGSTAFVTASMFESFPFDAQKAMACGTPVICYDNSSFGEVLGSACILLKNRDKTGFAKALKEVQINPDLRLKLRALGIQQARSFSVERTASYLKKIFAQVHKEEYIPDEK